MDKIEKTDFDIQIKQEQENEKARNKENEREVLIMNYEEDYFYENIDEEANTEDNEDTYKGNGKLELDQHLDEANAKGVNKKNDCTNRDKDDAQVTPYQKPRCIKKLNDPNRKLFCANCDFKAVKKHHLVNHIKLAHGRNRQPKQIVFECEHCMFSTRFKTSLMIHISVFHLAEIGHDSKNVKKKSCYDVQGVKIEDHSKLDKNGLYSCNYCSFTTSKKVGLKHHVAIHIVGKKPVKQCPHCPLRFIEAVLDRHLQKVHNPEGLFKCPKCYYVTKYKNNLRRHIKKNRDLKTCAPIQERRTSVFKKNSEKNKKSKV